MDAPLQEWVWLARIRRPQGRKGEVFAEILTDFPEKFLERRHVWLLSSSADDVYAAPGRSSHSAVTSRPPEPSAVPRSAEIIHHWLHKGGVVLHFAGIDSISAAESLGGCAVVIPRGARAPLGPDEVYISDLIGCTLIDVAGSERRVVGPIENVERDAGPVPLLLVGGASGEILVPFAREYLLRIDLEARQLEMNLPEGLVDLNAESPS